MRRLLPIVCTCALATGCTRTIYIPLESSRTETSAASATIRDSVYVSDTVRIFQRADTVVQQSIRTIRRDRLITDTVIVCRSDTVTIRTSEPPMTKSRHGPAILRILASILPAVLGAFMLLRFLRQKR